MNKKNSDNHAVLQYLEFTLHSKIATLFPGKPSNTLNAECIDMTYIK